MTLDWKERCPDKIITAEEAASKVKAGDTIRFPMVMVPVTLATALAARRGEVKDVRICHAGPAPLPGVGWWSLGGTAYDGTTSWWSDDPPASYPDPIGPIAGRVLNQDDTIFVGQNITVPPIDALSNDLSTVLFTRSSTRDVVSVEVIDTPLGRYECFRVEVTETVDLNDGMDPYTVDYVRWERPEMGLLKLHAEGIQLTYGTETVTVTSLDCLIRTYRQ